TPAPQPTTAQVASLTGQQLQSAVQRLDQSGLKASVAYVPSDQPFGTVVAQAPASGASATTRPQGDAKVPTRTRQKPSGTRAEPRRQADPAGATCAPRGRSAPDRPQDAGQ